MPSFNTLSLIATFACVVFTSAAPLPSPVDAALGPRTTGRLPSTRDLPSLPTILGDLTIQLTPLVAQLAAVVPANATVEALTPVTQSIMSVVGTSLVEVKGLAGQPIDVVLATADGVLSIPELARILAHLLSMVFTALGTVLSVVGSVRGDVGGLLCQVGTLIGELLCAILSIVGGLLAVLVPLILDLGPIILNLNLSNVADYIVTVQ